MTKVELFRSVIQAIHEEKTYQQWLVSACVEFKLFASPLEKRLRELVHEAIINGEGEGVLEILSMMKGLPHTLREKPKHPLLAGHLKGVCVDFNGRPVKEARKVKIGKISPLSRFQGVGANKADKKYVVSLRKR